MSLFQLSGLFFCLKVSILLESGLFLEFQPFLLFSLYSCFFLNSSSLFFSFDSNSLSLFFESYSLSLSLLKSYLLSLSSSSCLLLEPKFFSSSFFSLSLLFFKSGSCLPCFSSFFNQSSLASCNFLLSGSIILSFLKSYLSFNPLLLFLLERDSSLFSLSLFFFSNSSLLFDFSFPGKGISLSLSCSSLSLLFLLGLLSVYVLLFGFNIGNFFLLILIHVVI